MNIFGIEVEPSTIAMLVFTAIIVVGYYLVSAMLRRFKITRDNTFTTVVIVIPVSFVYVLVGWFAIISMPDWLEVVVSASAGLFIAFAMIPFIPNAMQLLVNNPNHGRKEESPDDNQTVPNYDKSQFGFFTFLQPGRVKIIERGNRFIRAIMRLESHMFKGERSDLDLSPRHQEYWEVIQTPEMERDSGPVPVPWVQYQGYDWYLWIFYSPVSVLLWAWKRLVYRWTGGVFTGIYPFQRVRTYPIEHFKRITLETGEIKMQRILDYSDHYRVADFQHPVKVPHAHTYDKIPVKVLVNVVARVFNPYLTAFNTDDDWGSRLTAAVNDAITTYVRPRKVDEVLSTEKSTVGELAIDIKKIGGVVVNAEQNEEKVGEICAFGLIVRSVQILDISPSNAKDEEKLGDVAIARVDKESRTIRAEGDAEFINATGRALTTYPEAGFVLQIDGMVRAAQSAAKEGNLVILPAGAAFDPGQAAQLQELRRIRGGDKR